MYKKSVQKWFLLKWLRVVGAGVLTTIFVPVANGVAGVVHIHWAADAPEKLAAANVVLYQQLVAFRDSDPSRFDHSHPFFGQLLTNTALMNQVVHRWERNEQRFEYWHPYLWRILDGYVDSQLITPPPAIIEPPPDSNSGGGGGGGGGGSVPEPSSICLLVGGLGLISLFASRRSQDFGGR